MNVKFIKDICKMHGWPEPNQEGFDRVIELKIRYICVNRAKKGFKDDVEAWADPDSYQNVLNSFDPNKNFKVLEDLIWSVGDTEPHEFETRLVEMAKGIKTDQDLRHFAVELLIIQKELIDGYKLLLR